MAAEQQFGRYTMYGELGRGGFATVYQAHDTGLRRDVALKLLHPQLLTDPAFVTRFENDARATAQLDHPRIATIYDLGHHEGRMFMAVQLLAGGSLADRIKAQGRLSLPEVVRVVDDIAQALDYAHAAGFIHRDVKPSNILFNRRGDAILTDFGLVKAAESSVIARTTMGGLIGTPAYMAPEIWEGSSEGSGTDVYALGCVLFEMLSGKLLFTGATPPAVMLAHFQPHRYPETWPEGTPPAIEAVLERALARDPAARYPSAGALAADLQALAKPAADQLAAQEQSKANPLENQAAERLFMAAHAPGVAPAAKPIVQPSTAPPPVDWLPAKAEAPELTPLADSTAQPEATPTDQAGQQPRLHADPASRPPPSELPRLPARPIAQPTWWPALVISAGWVLGWIASVWLGWALEREDSLVGIGTLIGWLLGWACGGLIAGLGMRLVGRNGAARLLWLMISWPVCMFMALFASAMLYQQQPERAILILALGCAVVGVITGAALVGIGRALAWAQFFLLGLGWGIGWLLTEAGLSSNGQHGPWHLALDKLGTGYGFHEIFWGSTQLNPLVLSAGGIVGAAIGAGLIRMFAASAGKRKEESR